MKCVLCTLPATWIMVYGCWKCDATGEFRICDMHEPEFGHGARYSCRNIDKCGDETIDYLMEKL